MKKHAKKLLSIALAAATAVSLVACSQEVAESTFDSPLPWHASTVSYEKLDYTVAVYNTVESEAEDERVKIADGTLSFVLDEGAEAGYTTLDMTFSVTYDSTEKAGADAGLTDKIESHVVFLPNSLVVKSMTKKVTLADRENKTNLSYTINADYFDAHTATLKYFKQDGATENSLALPSDACRDNEMMFFLARATDISAESSTNFKMVNVFDSFVGGEIAEYRMSVTGSSERKINVGDWVKDFGVPNTDGQAEGEAAEQESEIDYSVNCYTTSIAINDEKHGPSYYVYYAKDSFIFDDAAHKKIPVKIDYSSYNGTNPYRHTTYTLSACAFTK